MKAIVKSVQSTGSFDMEIEGKGTITLFKFEYEFEDGTILTANHKTNTSPFPAGTPVEYEVKKTHPEHGKSGSVKKPDSGQHSGSQGGFDGIDPMFKQRMIVKQNALGHATELLKHNSIMDGEGAKMKADDVIALAEKYKDWVMNEELSSQADNMPS